MAEITLVKPCRLTLSSGEVVNYRAGRHVDLPDEIANHWWMQLHSDNPPPSLPPQPGTPQYVVAQQVARRQSELAKQVAEQQIADAADAMRQQVTRRAVAKPAVERKSTKVADKEPDKEPTDPAADPAAS